MCVGLYSGNKTAGSCLIDSMESAVNVFKAKTKFLNDMYVYHTVRQEAQLSPRDRAMRRVIEILPIATQQCRNYLYDKS